MLNETRIVLANLDWLVHHLDMRLDFGAGVVLDRNGQPEFTLDDLAIIGLTPATELSIMWVDPGLWDAAALLGREVRIKVRPWRDGPEDESATRGGSIDKGDKRTGD